ncbi:MAG TPA: FAD-dependent monooxygenase, partial [Xanthobacteraceae bacterium]|nr:FAD-dependent monooxygenase [Xanthobacteraceae bacterium]
SPSLVYGRVALVGDAASTSRPHMGFGVSKAGGDAQALAEALRGHGDDVDAALDQYNAVRQPIGERIMLHGRKLGAHFGVNLKTDEDRHWCKLLQSHEEVMDRIGTPNFLE